MITSQFAEEFDPRFKVFHELMANKVREILLVSTPYDAWIMEAEGRLSEQVISEYRGLNLSQPPRLRWVPSLDKALAALDHRQYDMVIGMSCGADRDAFTAAEEIKQKVPKIPVVLLSRDLLPGSDQPESESHVKGIRRFLWSGNKDILVALVKSVEDQLNVLHDTTFAGIRVLILVEDSPVYLSTLLPILYKELVIQTQKVMEEGLNEDHRLLAMRGRPKVLIAESYEEALRLYDRYEPFVLGVLSDVRFSRDGVKNDRAGVDLLKHLRDRRFDIPLLLMSADSSNAERAAEIPATFVDKNAQSLMGDVRAFMQHYLGFGDFVFRMPDRTEIARAGNLRVLAQELQKIPEASFIYHCDRNDFSRWLFARSEIEFASEVRPLRDDQFTSVEVHRQHLISIIHTRLRQRQKGLVVDFDPQWDNPESEIMKVGNGSLGGKARGLAFASAYILCNTEVFRQFDTIDVNIPQTLVLTVDCFNEFIALNRLASVAEQELSDKEIAERFLAGAMPESLDHTIREYLAKVTYPLAVRSSSRMEDDRFSAYAGLYKTYMLSNDHADFEIRLEQLRSAIKLVYASMFYREPRAFARRSGHLAAEEAMAVILQRLIGEAHGDCFYPDISGVAHSRNHYPFGSMKAEEGIATIALGLGKMVVEGGKTLRFSPARPQLLPQRSSVNDILNYSQREFFALKLGESTRPLGLHDEVTLVKRSLTDAEGERPVNDLCSTYVPQEDRIRESTAMPGQRILTFASILKHDAFPLASVLSSVLALGQEGMGCPVEVEFSVNLGTGPATKPEFSILQLRPITAREKLGKVDITQGDVDRAFCYSTQALGNGLYHELADVIYVKPDRFDPANTQVIAQDIGRLNDTLAKEGRPYLLIGPGRWGSADPWLGIPVTWSQICGVGAMVEIDHERLNAEPSQGSHFFHNITTLGIPYLTISRAADDFVNWAWLTSRPHQTETDFVAHLRFAQALVMKADGAHSQCVVMADEASPG